MSRDPVSPSLFDAFEVLILPGWKNSGPDHWQSRWQRRFPAWRRVEQASWLHPRRQDWIQALDSAVATSRKPVLLIAHSLGCATVAHWAARQDAGRVAAALLVAPADVERLTVAGALRGFAPLPRLALPFPTLLLGSDDDPACSAWRASELAQGWGADFRLLPGHGHINAESDLGDWEAGLQLLRGWLAGKRTVPVPGPGFRWVA